MTLRSIQVWRRCSTAIPIHFSGRTYTVELQVAPLPQGSANKGGRDSSPYPASADIIRFVREPESRTPFSSQRHASLWEELAACELALDARGAVRLALMVALPLGTALIVGSGWLHVLSGLLVGFLCFPLVRGWGYSAMALISTVLLWYSFLLNAPLSWPPLFFGAAITTVLFAFLVVRLRQIRDLRTQMQSSNVDSRYR